VQVLASPVGAHAPLAERCEGPSSMIRIGTPGVAGPAGTGGGRWKAGVVHGTRGRSQDVGRPLDCRRSGASQGSRSRLVFGCEWAH
jgi:hypothetical protein